MLNGKLAIFLNGVRAIDKYLNTFFTELSPPEIGSTRSMADPRAWYDDVSDRWVVCAFDKNRHTNNRFDVILAVSKGPTLSLDANDWYPLPFSATLGDGELLDFTTLGVDANGIYISIQVRGAAPLTSNGFLLKAFKKSAAYNGIEVSVLKNVPPSELDSWAIQPVHNYDSQPAYAWFVAKGADRQIWYRRLQWNGDTADWVGSWAPVAGNYLDYYDIPQGNRAVNVLPAPQSGGFVDLGLDGKPIDGRRDAERCALDLPSRRLEFRQPDKNIQRHQFAHAFGYSVVQVPGRCRTASPTFTTIGSATLRTMP